MIHSTATRAAVLALAVALASGCAVARWHVLVAPLQGQSAEQQATDADACDAEAKAASGYDRGVEAKTWLWGVVAIPSVIVTATVAGAAHVATLGAMEPEVKRGGAAAMEAITATRPKGNPSWKGYFEQYRICMARRGYAPR